MNVVGILNTKGGAGKTTLVTCLAVRAAKDGLAAVLDLDPQSSYSLWYKLRGSPDNPALLTGADRASEAVEALQLTSPYDFVFLDGPPGSILVTEDAVKVSTFVIIPVRTSVLDLHASRDCIALCQEHGTPFFAVINATRAPGDKRLIEETKGILSSWDVPVAKQPIGHRIAYTDAITTGRTGPEKDRKAAAEIDALWKEILTAVRKAAKGRRHEQI